MPVSAELIPLVKALSTCDELKDALVFQVRNLGPVGIHSIDGVVQLRVDLVIRLKCCIWTVTDQQCIESVELSVVGITNMQFSLATAAGLFKSVVSFVLVVTSYVCAYKFADYKIF